MNIKIKEKNGTCAIRLAMFHSVLVISFQYFCYLATYVYAKGNKHIHIYTHSERQ